MSGTVGFGAGAGCGGSSSDSSSTSPAHPNILLLMVDQFQTPPEGYGENEGVLRDLREIFSFQDISPDNAFTGFFPALLRLRQNAVVMQKHHTASSACVPSRTCIMTGQYNTGVEQTDGIFKSAEETTWLDPDGPPTIGDWFRAFGYTTHYFGKWHVSDLEPPDYMDPWGFSDWELSYPEPHGSKAYNLGVFRDVGFADNLVDFLAKKGTSDSSRPWLAVGSLVNPHDVGAWPVSWQLPGNQGVVPWTVYPPPPSIPAAGEESLPDDKARVVDLNPDGFPQDNCTLPSTFDETLADKPRCQYDYSLKYGLAMRSKSALLFPYPFQLQEENAAAWSLAFNQFYFYCHYLADLQLRRMLQALDDAGLAENTIVVFLSDHGEMTGAHGGMIQKWHNAYEEAVRVPLVISSPLVNGNKLEPRYITQPTSSIDLAPTLLGLAGFHAVHLTSAQDAMKDQIINNDFVGTDLSPFIMGKTDGDIPGPDGRPRPGVFFRTNDTITELGPNPDADAQDQYDSFLANVELVKTRGYPLVSGPVRQPNAVRALCTGDWKIVRYVDPHGIETDEWELYYLTADPVERTNLVDFRTGEIRDDVTVPGWTAAELAAKKNQLRVQLAEQEKLMMHA
ncbi:MAG: sulfatase-like hydrolase/transferase [Pseudomonadota bacterium]